MRHLMRIALILFLLATASLTGLAQQTPVTTLHLTRGKVSRKEGSEVRSFIRSIVDVMIGERNPGKAARVYFLLNGLSDVEKAALYDSAFDSSEDSAFLNSRNLSERALPRCFANGWNYEYQPILLALGRMPLSRNADFAHSFHEAQSDIDAERDKILSRKGIRQESFYRLLDVSTAKSNKELVDKLSVLESIDAELNRFIKDNSNQALFQANIQMIKRHVGAIKLRAGRRIFYGSSFAPMFEVLLTRRGNKLKVIGFRDTL